ncbi:glutamate--tRNA ligase [bacterium]|jgi:glutamyl-tRNA synthetase|nr:glutamate--tRNA ligase [bacterium]MBT3794989.1 glutamate--tRNA ligase [bacterium]MBT4634811.1 glutamate--tRNA ligase [bacterium]
MNIITRFAPSPTGSLHLGAVRTAIFNFLFTKRNKGKFILRIEDTDQERSTNDSLDEILKSLNWLGVDYDDGPHIQSDRLSIYKKIAQDLVDKNLAYKCFMKNEEIEELKNQAAKEKKVYRYPRTWRDRTDHPENAKYVIRFKTPDSHIIEFSDTLRGTIKIGSDNLDDFIILKSDGYPTYNFSTVIDDAEMGITNVIRGEDHLSNTSKQTLIFDSLNKKPPLFTHVSMILGKDKTKLSKRNGSKSIQDFKDEGILPIAILNYLARLGWSHGDQEIFTLDEMVDLFDINNLTKSPAIFDEDKLKWVNSQHLKRLSNNDLLKVVKVDFYQGINIDLALSSAKVKAKDTIMLNESLKFCESELIKIGDEFIDDLYTKDTKEIIEAFYTDALDLKSFEIKEIKDCMNIFLEKRGLKMKQIALPLRIILTGSKASPGIFEVISILGKEIFSKRIEHYLES